MKLFVSNELNIITGDPGISAPVDNIQIPRNASVPILVQFTDSGTVYDPEILTGSIASHTAAPATVITATQPHGLTNGDTVVISGVTGSPIPISSAAPLAPLTATMTSATPCVITTATHNLAVGDIVIFQTTGKLYTGLTPGVPYFVTAVPSSTTFHVSDTLGGTEIATSGSQSGTHYASTPFTVVTTASAHGLSTNDQVTIAGVPTETENDATILTSSLDSPSILTTASPHGLSAGDTINITAHVGIPVNIASISAASPAVITTAIPHGLSIGDFITIAGIADGTFASPINGQQTVGSASFSTTAFTVGINCSMAPTASTGAVMRPTSTPTLNGLWTATPINSTQFKVGLTLTNVGAGGIAARGPSNINGTFSAISLTSTTFAVKSRSASIQTGGTSTGPSSAPTINGSFTATVIDGLTFSIPVTVTVPGTGGIFTRTTALMLRWTVKALNSFDEDPPLASISAGSFTKIGSGATTIFKGFCNYITAALNGLFGIEATVGPNSLTSISNGTPALVTMAAPQSFTNGDVVIFATSGTLPSPLVAGQEYYITVLSTTTFNIAATATGALINTTSAGSGSHTYTRFKSTDDVVQVAAMAELSWSGSDPGKTNWVNHTIRNDLYRGSESAPIQTNGINSKVALGSGVFVVTVTFSTALPSANWHFNGMPLITNMVDATPLNLTVETLTARSASGFTIQLSGTTDSANYVIEFQARPD